MAPDQRLLFLLVFGVGVWFGCRTSPGNLAAAPAAAPSASKTQASTPCEIAYEQTKAAIEASARNPGGGEESNDGLPEITLAPRDVFLRDCRTLPEEVQRCLVFEYAFENNAGCREARARYDDAQTRR